MRRFRSVMAVLALSCAAAVPSLAEAGKEQSATSMQQRSAQLARTYLQTWSSNPRAALDQVPRLYALRTRFYGQLVDHRRLIREKAGFIRRWPIRHYAHRPGSMSVACEAHSARCFVRSVIDWRAASPARHAASRGSARFEQGIDLSGSRPVVFLEGGSVLASAPVRLRDAAQPRDSDVAQPRQAARPVSHSLVSSRMAAEPVSLPHQRAVAVQRSLPSRQHSSGSPAVKLAASPEHPAALSFDPVRPRTDDSVTPDIPAVRTTIARAPVPVLTKADPVQTGSSPSSQAPPPAATEVPREWVDPPRPSRWSQRLPQP